VFESFLREFLVEQATARIQALDKYCLTCVNKHFNEVYKMLPHAAAVIERAKEGVKFAHLSSGSPLEEHVDGFVEAVSASFQNIRRGQDIDRLYKKILGKAAFAKRLYRKSSVFANEEDKENCYTDIRLLLLLRNQLVHRDGVGRNKYRSDMFELKFWTRLHPKLKEEYVPISPNGDEESAWKQCGVVPPPDRILISQAMDEQQFSTKLEECETALRRYAQYIVDVFVDD
jgi:hypothetical protein